ncbi:related to RNA polymerase II holoenzyme/mediator subunit [Ramularia collo-cygni]|uniref:Mediator of RNA polymerase II transcription subunit 21 n=1 Tax=Ramularia collo-cygni TaxID=112498 RepID=A0A2D3UTT9_9PEZI|nr:related to RNA polymerase II holoenzyme/mediator subunit [Ramularia collo-cygni]CZT19911.1 related to RNA polymerase II holoenzyme/mediator subunit [Ramularia collo-cygni]
MADRLTQLQDCIDVLNTLMFASLNYVHTRHPYGEIPGQPSQAPHPSGQENGTANGDAQQGEGQTGSHEAGAPTPEEQRVFNAALREMAQDVVLQEQQIEIIVNQLPGIGSSEADQERRMRELEVEMREIEEQRAKKETEREKMVDMLGEIIGRVKRVP